jgi:hypothetical protein
MNDSRIENLLQQMSLKEPSAKLDDWVEGIACSTESVRNVRPGQRAARKLLPAVAVACLLIGVVIGRATTTKAVADEVAEAQSERTNKAASERMWSPKKRRPDDGHGSGTQEDVNIAIASLEGPQVATLCSLGIQDVPASAEDRCLKCHSGVRNQASGEDESKFDGGYVQDFHRQLCAKCHDMSGKREHLELRQIGDAIHDQPWHKVRKEESPTK